MRHGELQETDHPAQVVPAGTSNAAMWVQGRLSVSKNRACGVAIRDAPLPRRGMPRARHDRAPALWPSAHQPAAAHPQATQLRCSQGAC